MKTRIGTLVVAAIALAACGGTSQEGDGDADADAAKARQEIALASPQTSVPVIAAATAGWAGQSLLDATANDWEPAVGADPSAPYVYAAVTRYGGAKACKTCPSPAIVFKVSPSPRAAQVLLKNQADPELEVAANGTVYAVWMNVWEIEFAKSTDHGATFSLPKKLSGTLAWADKPLLAISANGQDLYVAFNKSDPYVVVSHDGGATFTAPKRIANDGRYHYTTGGYVPAGGGTVTLVGNSYTQANTGDIEVESWRSADGGVTWTRTLVDTVSQQPDCTSAGCPFYFTGSQDVLAADAFGHLAVVYNGGTTTKAPARMWVRRSTDAGATWTARTDISAGPAANDQAFPAAVGGGNGDFRVWFMDGASSTGPWNVWFRRSMDAGATWSVPLRISDASSGPSYINPAGFQSPYGDYGEIAVRSNGGTIGVWGEGVAYDGPGGTWVNRTTP